MLSCEDQNTCAAKRSEAVERALFNPRLGLLLLALFGGGVGYVLPRIGLAGGRSGVVVGQSIGIALSLGCIGLAVWSWRFLESHHVPDWGGLFYVALTFASAALGLGMLLTSLFVAPRRSGISTE
jgi:hypothetical protein